MIRTWTPESEQPNLGPVVDYHTVKAWFQQCRDCLLYTSDAADD